MADNSAKGAGSVLDDDLRVGSQQVSLKLLSSELAAAGNEYETYLDSRSRFAEEFLQTGSYYQRERFIQPFQALGKPGKQRDSWIIHLYADGGMGKPCCYGG